MPLLFYGQFYNGHQMTFGKNRVQYRDFFWNYYRFQKFDIYFYDQGEGLAKYTHKFVDKKLVETENFFGHSLQKRIIFILYNRQSEYKQSNIGLVSGNEEYNTGGVMKIIDNKVFLYFEGDHKKFEEQVSAAIAEVVFTEMIYGGNMREKLASSTLLNIPDWYMKGLISYVANNWSIETENRVKDGILNGRYKKFNRLSGEDAVYAGHSFWRYIAEVYGKPVIPNIVYMTKVNKNPESGFLFVLGLSLKEITPDWIEFYKVRYNRDTTAKAYTPDALPIVKRPKKRKVYQNVKISPDGKYIAYTTNELGKYKLYLYDIEKGRKKKIFKRGQKIEQETDYSFPVLSWHPKGDILSFITEEKGHLYLNNYFIKKKNRARRILPYEKVLDIDYSDDGLKIALSGVNKGMTDIYVFSTIAGTSEQITKDLADDFNPRFIDNDTRIVFSSNRKSDTLRFEKYIHAETAKTMDIFVYDYKKKTSKLTRITKTGYINEEMPVGLRRNIFTYLSDENGINNLHIARFDSTISFIDTTTHYRHFTESYPLTNYPSNIIEYDATRDLTYAEILYNDGRNALYFDTLKTKRNSFEGEYKDTEFRKILTKTYIEQDSLRLAKQKEKEKEKKEVTKVPKKNKIEPPPKIDPDSILIDIRNYIFEREKYSDYYNSLAIEKRTKPKEKKKFKFPKKRNYNTTFFTNYIVNQVDFGFLNTSYQAFTGSAVYFNPGFNVLFKIGTNDLFEDYKIIGGMRLSGNFDSNEFLLSWENLKDRWDKQMIYHRQVYKNSTGIYNIKTSTQELMHLLKFPFNQVSSARLTTSFRHDKVTLMARDFFSLKVEDSYRTWGGLKLEYIFDNSRSLGINLHEGTRAKAWFEAYKEVGKEKSDLFVIGGDFRHYVRIHRSLIWASRIAASTSFGQARLIYYLGAVDNWINYSADVQTFDRSTNINDQINWAYQTVATNLRGFPQNVRNGNSFLLINNEIRFPVFRYFANRPLNSDFFNNFQVVGFSDIGTAFCGASPSSEENAYNQRIIDNEAIKVIVDNHKSPFVGGVGFGFRSRLFGYFLRTDWAWGIENGEILDRIFYLSLSLDF